MVFVFWSSVEHSVEVGFELAHMAKNELNDTALVPMPPQFQDGGAMGYAKRLPTPLVDRNVLLDEIVQMKHDMKVLQLEARRIGDDVQHRLGGVNTRLQAHEANARTIDRREADHFETLQQHKRESDTRLKEVLEEMIRFRREVEGDVSHLNQETRNEIRERDGHIQQVFSYLPPFDMRSVAQASSLHGRTHAARWARAHADRANQGLGGRTLLADGECHGRDGQAAQAGTGRW
jgi:hypothetical protein